MKNIIVPTDFSVKSYHALALAKKIARKNNATIHLVHIVEPTTGSYSSMGEVLDDDFDDIFTLKLAEKLAGYLVSIKKANEDPSFKINEKLKVGSPFYEIKSLVEKVDADLVIIGAKGATDADEFFIGSLADKMIRSYKCPVISVKESPDDANFENLVFATDLKKDDDSLIKVLKQFQKLFDAQVHIVKINTRKNFNNDIDTRVALEKLADKYELENYTLNIYNNEDEEYGIVYFADEKDADLILMGVHEKSGFRRLISGGSLANEVTDHTYRPVLTYQFSQK